MTPEVAAERAIARPRAGRWAWLVGTFFGVGRLRPGPGSWASAATMLLWRGLAQFIAPAWQAPSAALAAAVVVLVGIPAASRVARECGDRDPSFVVIDEVAGQLIALIAVPLAWKSLLAGFILFRGFDILKPAPLRRLERIPEGAGIILDDVGAGLYALVVMQGLLHWGVLR